jgi:hypothetical protein
MGFENKKTQAMTGLPLGVELEYKTLRDEILLRINLRQQHIQHTLIFFGTLVGVALQSTHLKLALLYLPLAFFLALGWLQTDLRIRYISTYISKNLEPTFNTKERKGWENSIKDILNNNPTTWRILTISHAGVFFFTQFVAIVVGLNNPIKLIIKIVLDLTNGFFSIGARLAILPISPIEWGLLMLNSLFGFGVLLIWLQSIKRDNIQDRG